MSEINYTEAFGQLQQIVEEIESGDISVDVLAAKVEKAAELIKICQGKLTQTESNVNHILSDLNEEK